MYFIFVNQKLKIFFFLISKSLRLRNNKESIRKKRLEQMRLQPLVTTFERHLFSCIRNGINQRGCNSYGMFCGVSAHVFVIGSGLESAIVLYVYKSPVWLVCSYAMYVKQRHLFDNEARQPGKWIVESVWQTKWFLDVTVRIRRWMLTCDEDVSFFPVPRRWSKHLITFRRLTLFYRQTMNRQVKLTQNVTCFNRYLRGNDMKMVSSALFRRALKKIQVLAKVFEKSTFDSKG